MFKVPAKQGNLGKWTKKDEMLSTWSRLELENLQMDNRKSVSNKAAKLMKAGKAYI